MVQNLKFIDQELNKKTIVIFFKKSKKDQIVNCEIAIQGTASITLMMNMDILYGFIVWAY